MASLTIIRTNSENADFLQLVQELDRYLAIRNGDSNDFFAQFNKVENLAQVVLVYLDNIPVGCGAIKEFDSETMEIKRMFVPNNLRGKGIASQVLRELEVWTKELGYKKTILETGKDMVDAVGLYQKNQYQIIPNYGQYIEVESSVCMEKIL